MLEARLEHQGGERGPKGVTTHEDEREGEETGWTHDLPSSAPRRAGCVEKV